MLEKTPLATFQFPPYLPHGSVGKLMSLQSEMLVEQKVSNAQKSTGTAYLLWFFLGGFGAHRFYLGKTGTAVTQLIITLIGCFTLFPLIITGIWWIVEPS